MTSWVWRGKQGKELEGILTKKGRQEGRNEGSKEEGDTQIHR
jgi:hypothetical protein